MANVARILQFWTCLALVPIVLVAAELGGWALALPAIATWWVFGMIDAAASGPPAAVAPARIKAWQMAITRIWPPVQLALLAWLLWTIPSSATLAVWEKISLFAGMGILAGTVGIVQAHELMHRSSVRDRLWADLLMASVLYSHFRSEHLLVHHVHVATSRDPATARLGEGFWRFLPRVLLSSAVSAWNAETARLKRRRDPAWSLRNPFWRYGLLQAAMLFGAWLLGGWPGLGLFMVQAFVAVWQLELINYIEHYGLTRATRPDGRAEPVRPHHSWNARQRASAGFLINLPYHPDHHARPAVPFPELRSLPKSEAPQLPQGYPAMAALALIPPLWRRVMDPRVAAWRRRFYPDASYSAASASVN